MPVRRWPSWLEPSPDSACQVGSGDRSDRPCWPRANRGDLQHDHIAVRPGLLDHPRRRPAAASSGRNSTVERNLRPGGLHSHPRIGAASMRAVLRERRSSTRRAPSRMRPCCSPRERRAERRARAVRRVGRGRSAKVRRVDRSPGLGARDHHRASNTEPGHLLNDISTSRDEDCGCHTFVIRPRLARVTPSVVARMRRRGSAPAAARIERLLRPASHHPTSSSSRDGDQENRVLRQSQNALHSPGWRASVGFPRFGRTVSSTRSSPPGRTIRLSTCSARLTCRAALPTACWCRSAMSSRRSSQGPALFSPSCSPP